MAAALTSLLRALSLSNEEADHEAVLRSCNEALREDRNDLDAQHARVIALSKLDRHEDVLRQFEDAGPRLREQARLAYGYALYKQGNFTEAVKQAKEVDSRGGRHLEAQALYRLQDFVGAAAVLKELHNGSFSEAEENDLRINTSATDAQLEWQRKEDQVSRRKPSRENLEAFETAFNTACASIARGELPQAKMLLDRAKSLCKASPDISEEEREAELLSISVQQLFVNVLLGKDDQVKELLKGLDVDAAPVSSAQQLAQVNKIVADRTSFNPFLSSRIMKAKPKLPPSDQLFDYQSALFTQNEVALEFLSGKFKGIESTTSKKLQLQPSVSTSRELNAASSANAAAHAQLEQGKPGIRAISPLLKRRPHDIGLTATMVQLYVSTRNHGSAIKLVEGLCSHLEQSATEKGLEARYSPGLVAIVVSLYSLEKRTSGVRRELAKAAAYWQQKKSTHPVSLLKAAGYSLIQSGKEEDIAEAKNIFATLSGGHSSDKFVKTGTIASQASSDPDNAARSAKTLPTIDKLISGIDVDSLDSAGIPQPVSTATILSRKRAADASKPPKKRLRKSRLPKDYDPNKKVDPERWLPMRDRSYYKPKKSKKGKKAASGGAQGAIAAEDAVPRPTPVLGSGGGGGGGANKKKKKNKK